MTTRTQYISTHKEADVVPKVQSIVVLSHGCNLHLISLTNEAGKFIIHSCPMQAGSDYQNQVMMEHHTLQYMKVSFQVFFTTTELLC
jgi:hypothetical protein